MPVVQPCRQPDLEAVDQPIDRAGRARTGKQHDMLVAVRAYCLADDLARVVAKARRLQPRARGFGVRVGVQRQDGVAQVVLDERERAARGRVVGVGHAAQPERAGHGLVGADDRGADRLDECFGAVRFHGADSAERPMNGIFSFTAGLPVDWRKSSTGLAEAR
ncbi:MAG: hypothetical protein U1F67_09300 [Rubrivivax sp.]